MRNTHLHEKFLSLFVFRFCAAIFFKVFNVWSKKCFLLLFRKNILRKFLISLIFQIARQSNKSASLNVKDKLLYYIFMYEKKITCYLIQNLHRAIFDKLSFGNYYLA